MVQRNNCGFKSFLVISTLFTGALFLVSFSPQVFGAEVIKVEWHDNTTDGDNVPPTVSGYEASKWKGQLVTLLNNDGTLERYGFKTSYDNSRTREAAVNNALAMAEMRTRLDETSRVFRWHDDVTNDTLVGRIFDVRMATTGYLPFEIEDEYGIPGATERTIPPSYGAVMHQPGPKAHIFLALSILFRSAYDWSAGPGRVGSWNLGVREINDIILGRKLPPESHVVILAPGTQLVINPQGVYVVLDQNVDPETVTRNVVRAAGPLGSFGELDYYLEAVNKDLNDKFQEKLGASFQSAIGFTSQINAEKIGTSRPTIEGVRVRRYYYKLELPSDPFVKAGMVARLIGHLFKRSHLHGAALAREVYISPATGLSESELVEAALKRQKQNIPNYEEVLEHLQGLVKEGHIIDLVNSLWDILMKGKKAEGDHLYGSYWPMEELFQRAVKQRRERVLSNPGPGTVPSSCRAAMAGTAL